MKFEVRVAALLTIRGCLLVQYRRGADEGKRKYALVGGHLNVGEPFAEALRREFEEELGLAVKVGRLVCVVENFYHEGEPYRNSVGELIQPEEVHELGLYFETAPACPDRWPSGAGELRCREAHIAIGLVPLAEALQRLMPECLRPVVEGGGAPPAVLISSRRG